MVVGVPWVVVVKSGVDNDNWDVLARILRMVHVGVVAAVVAAVAVDFAVKET
jgi:hypothetical protein